MDFIVASAKPEKRHLRIHAVLHYGFKVVFKALTDTYGLYTVSETYVGLNFDQLTLLDQC